MMSLPWATALRLSQSPSALNSHVWPSEWVHGVPGVEFMPWTQVGGPVWLADGISPTPAGAAAGPGPSGWPQQKRHLQPQEQRQPLGLALSSWPGRDSIYPQGHPQMGARDPRPERWGDCPAVAGICFVMGLQGLWGPGTAPNAASGRRPSSPSPAPQEAPGSPRALGPRSLAVRHGKVKVPVRLLEI